MNKILTEKKEKNILHDKQWTFDDVETSTDGGHDRTLFKLEDEHETRLTENSSHYGSRRESTARGRSLNGVEI
jgi:hypothetical protein